MKIFEGGKGKPGAVMMGALLALLLVNTVLVGITFNLISDRYAPKDTQLGYEQEVAKDILEYNREFASELEVLERTSVKEALAQFNYEIETASSSDDLTSLIINQGRRLEEIILREGEIKLKDQVVSAINQDEKVMEIEDPKLLALEIDNDSLSVKPEDVLEDATVERIKDKFHANNPGRNQVIEVEISGGEAQLTVPYNPVEHIQSLNEEIDDLRLTNRELRVEAGFDEMRGEGIRVILSDREDAVTSDAIVHDSDVRDVVNELFDSGAKGIAVDEQRLTATSSIRCAGTLIEVNGKKVPMPVTIEAVGDQELLESGLEIIKNSWQVNREIGFEIEKVEEINLPSY